MSSVILFCAMHVLIFLLLFIETDAQACGHNPDGDANAPFIGLPRSGNNATEGSWPWMVAIRRRDSLGIYVPWCSGFLIDKKHVISAAHCYEGRNSYQARIGHINQDLADEYRIILIIIPVNYTVGRYYDDIAILTLDREVNFLDFNPICLPDEQLSRRNLNGHGASVAGWSGDRLGEHNSILKNEHNLPIISNKDCQRILRQSLARNVLQRHFPRGVNRDMFCTGSVGHKECMGDSGGPLMFKHKSRWFAIGIVTFGYHCGLGMSGYTNVTTYLGWIRENIAD